MCPLTEELAPSTEAQFLGIPERVAMFNESVLNSSNISACASFSARSLEVCVVVEDGALQRENEKDSPYCRAWVRSPPTVPRYPPLSPPLTPTGVATRAT